MNGVWTKIKSYYGFSKPYDFNVAIPALLNAAFLLVVLIKFIGALINNNKARIYGPVERNFLTFPSEMFYFYLYIFLGIPHCLAEAKKYSRKRKLRNKNGAEK